MKHLLFSFLLAGMIAAAQTAGAQCTNLPEVIAGVHGSHVYLTFYGEHAKKIFDEMPKSSKQAPNGACGLNRVIKVQGGFICTFATDANDPDCAHRCSVEVSAKTGKTAIRKKYDMCETDP